MLSISPQTVCFIVLRVHGFGLKSDDLATGSDGNLDDGETAVAVSEDDRDLAYAQLKTLIDELNEDEQLDLVSLAWIGRGDYGAAEWAEARSQARDSRSDHTAEYLLGMPLLPDYLEEGLSALDYSCEDFEMGRA